MSVQAGAVEIQANNAVSTSYINDSGGVAKIRASDLGPEGREFKSLCPDHIPLSFLEFYNCLQKSVCCLYAGLQLSYRYYNCSKTLSRTDVQQAGLCSN